MDWPPGACVWAPHAHTRSRPGRRWAGNISSWWEAHSGTTERCCRDSPASMSPLTPALLCSRAVRRAWKPLLLQFPVAEASAVQPGGCPGRTDRPTVALGPALRQNPGRQEAMGNPPWRARNMWPWCSKGRLRLRPGVRRIQANACTWPKPTWPGSTCVAPICTEPGSLSHIRGGRSCWGRPATCGSARCLAGAGRPTGAPAIRVPGAGPSRQSPLAMGTFATRPPAWGVPARGASPGGQSSTGVPWWVRI